MLHAVRGRVAVLCPLGGTDPLKVDSSGDSRIFNTKFPHHGDISKNCSCITLCVCFDSISQAMLLHTRETFKALMDSVSRKGITLLYMGNVAVIKIMSFSNHYMWPLIDVFCVSWDDAAGWISNHLIHDKPTLVRDNSWCRQKTDLCLNQFKTPYLSVYHYCL